MSSGMEPNSRLQKSAADQNIRLSVDLYLTPGDHWIRLQGSSGDYSVALNPLGPPLPDGERESNNAPLTAEPMLLGQTRSGRLVQLNDADYFRFSLAATEHVSLSVIPPADGTIKLALDWGQTRVAAASASEPGETMTLDLILLPGDYLVSLVPSVISDV